MRKYPAAVLTCATVLALTLAACGGSQETAQEAPAEETPVVTKTQTTVSINAEEALAIALSNAGLQESEVTVEEIGSGDENGVSVFEVKFYTNTMDYEYDVDANTGEILSSDIEYRN